MKQKLLTEAELCASAGRGLSWGRSPCCLLCLSSWVPWVRAVVRKKVREDGWEALRGCQQLQGEGNGNPLQYSCLENPMDRGAWWAAVHRLTQSWTWLKQLSMHACTGEGNGNPLQYSCLENSRGRGAWWATVCGVAQSWTRLKRLSSSAAAAAAASRKSRRAEWRAVNSESHQIFLVRAEWGMVVDYSGWSMLRLKKTCISLGLLAANLMWELVAAQVTTGGAVTGRKTGPPCIKSVVGCVWCFISASFSGLTVVCFPASTLSGIVISSNYRPLI